MDQLKAMRTFARVIDSGSFAGASRALDVAPAVVTRAVADLEQHLGARLMTRTTRRMALTPIGERYLERVRAILSDVDDAAALARQAQTEPDGVVRLIAPPLFAGQQLAPRLARFHRSHPKIAVELTARGPVESLDEAHDISIAVRRAPMDGDFVARRLARSQVIACATPEYLARAGRPAHPSQLAQHALLVPAAQRVLSFCHAADDEGGAPVSVDTTTAPLSSSNPAMTLASALAGAGIAVLASFAVEQALRERRLERVLPDWRLFDLSIWACMPTRKHVPAATRALMDFLVGEFADAEADPWVTDGPPASPVHH